MLRGMDVLVVAAGVRVACVGEARFGASSGAASLELAEVESLLSVGRRVVAGMVAAR